ncbi:MAG: dTMP kinase [Puniceicoccales bacterium]|jgi:dTMP kinase|nr:dTMP kinase [Puniceicoccales bacterium]
MAMKNGIFVTLEGSEGAGKSTQVALLVDRLRAMGRAVLTLREPGGTELGEEIRRLIRRVDFTIAPCAEAELLLFLASRAQLVREKILPALHEGMLVICDRYFDSTLAYQGAARSLPLEQIGFINAFAISKCVPHITFLLDLDPAEGLRRVHLHHGKEADDRMERETITFFEKVRAGYLSLAEREPDRFVILDAHKSIKAIHGEIFNFLCHRLGGAIESR